MRVQAVHGVLRRGNTVLSYYRTRRICPKIANAFDPPRTDDTALLTQLVITKRIGVCTTVGLRGESWLHPRIKTYALERYGKPVL